jgi:hypothetical protein
MKSRGKLKNPAPTVRINPIEMPESWVPAMRLVAGTSAKRAIAKQATPKTTLVWIRLLFKRDISRPWPVAVTALVLIIFHLKTHSDCLPAATIYSKKETPFFKVADQFTQDGEASLYHTAPKTSSTGQVGSALLSEMGHFQPPRIRPWLL